MQRAEASRAAGVGREWGWGSNRGLIIRPWWLLISPDCTDLAQCCTLAWVLRQNPRLYSSVPIPALPPPGYLEICLSASISENIRLLSPLPFPSPLCFLPQQAKSPAFSTVLRFHWTKTHQLESKPADFFSIQCGPPKSWGLQLAAGPLQLSLSFL